MNDEKNKQVVSGLGSINEVNNDEKEAEINKTVDRIQKLKDLLLAIANLSEGIQSSSYDISDIQRLKKGVNRFFFTIRNMELSEEHIIDLEVLKDSVVHLEGIDNIEDVQSIKQELNRIILFLKRLLPSIIKQIENIEELEEELWFVNDDLKLINIKFKDSIKMRQLLSKYAEINNKLLSLDYEYMNEEVDEKRFNLLRPILISKLSHIMKLIITTTYE